MIYFRIAHHESDCHGGGYYEDIEADDSLLDGLTLESFKTKCLDRQVIYGGGISTELRDWEKRESRVLHFAGTWPKVTYSETTIAQCQTWDVEITLFRISDEQWQELYKRCQDYGIHREWELKTFYDGIAYKRVVLDWKGDCD